MAAAAALAFTARTAPAQVGHAPGDSPYRDIRKGHALTAMFGHISGGGGRFGIAPHDGFSYGIRYDIRTASPVQMGIGFLRADLERLVVNPFVPPAERISGPFTQSILFAEFNLLLNLTGGKSWHRLAPFVGSAVGMTFSSGTVEDSSGFEFGRRIYLAPTVGTRIFLTDRLNLRAEARATFWKITYPASFQREPETGDPGSGPVITDGRVQEWSTTPWLQVGISYSFSP
jgi:hypothetical protein